MEEGPGLGNPSSQPPSLPPQSSSSSSSSSSQQLSFLPRQLDVSVNFWGYGIDDTSILVPSTCMNIKDGNKVMQNHNITLRTLHLLSYFIHKQTN